MEDTVMETPDVEESEFSREERIQFCRVVANMVAADHQVTEDERLYLAALTRQTGLSLLDEDVKQALDEELATPSQLEDLVKNVTNPDLRRTLYRTLVEVAFCDEGLAPEEEERLVAMAALFELNADAAKDLIHWTKESIELEHRESDIMARL
ncbi:MAG: TerB family tellurite resistance protein [Blastocatellia bacterium]|nr:TerB family tellurite resistance protein [Blastocatellia bacterium]